VVMLGHMMTTGMSPQRSVANMVSYAICSSLILVIHDNMINGANHIIEHVFVGISRSHGYYHKLTYHAKLTCHAKLTYHGQVNICIAKIQSVC
jgi:hypothetical protein